MPEEVTPPKHAGGRPLLFDNVEDLEMRINQYFDDCDKEFDTRKWEHDEIDIDNNGKRTCTSCYQTVPSRGCMLVSGELKRKRPYTTTGLAVWLQCSRRTLLNYECREEFFPTVKAARDRIENYAEECLFDPKVPTNGVKFSLSNNYDDWKEKSEAGVTLKTDPATKLIGAVLGVGPVEEQP